MLAIGCPVAHRDWIMDAWFDHVEAALSATDRSWQYVFVGDVEADPTFDVIRQRAPDAVMASIPNQQGWDRRDWSTRGRYEHMVQLRNELLGLVRELAPDAFLSIDSDILAHPQLVGTLLTDLSDGWGAVGSRCYMTPAGSQFPSWADLGRDGSLRRADSSSYCRVDVIMAIKMMSPEAFAVDYRFDPQGEDIGWSKACTEAGLRLGWDGRIVSKHVMEPHLLAHLDPRVGF